jgi:hypothetical protein
MWSSEVIISTLAYSAAAWDTMDKILHGETIEDQKAKEIAPLSKKITAAY